MEHVEKEEYEYRKILEYVKMLKVVEAVATKKCLVEQVENEVEHLVEGQQLQSGRWRWRRTGSGVGSRFAV